jgi:hypothetical protein
VRLAKWDQLAPAGQQKLLQNEAAIRALTEVTNGVSTNAMRIRSVMLQNTISNWNRLPAKDQKELSENFDNFFQLKPSERQKAVRILSKEEQAQIGVTLQKFGKLSPDQRAQCIQSFEKLAAMSTAERKQFQEHRALGTYDTQERENWRNLVKRPRCSASPTSPRPSAPVSMPRKRPLPPTKTELAAVYARLRL